MKILDVETAMELCGGWDRCAICGTTVNGGFWKKYAHCVKHAWNAVFPIYELLDVCFNIKV